MTLQSPLLVRESRVTSLSSGWLPPSSRAIDKLSEESEGTGGLGTFMLVDLNT